MILCCTRIQVSMSRGARQCSVAVEGRGASPYKPPKAAYTIRRRSRRMTNAASPHLWARAPSTSTVNCLAPRHIPDRLYMQQKFNPHRTSVRCGFAYFQLIYFSLPRAQPYLREYHGSTGSCFSDALYCSRFLLLSEPIPLRICRTYCKAFQQFPRIQGL